MPGALAPERRCLAGVVHQFAVPDQEAQRLALLVQVHVQQADALAIIQDSRRWRPPIRLSPYADALSAAGCSIIGSSIGRKQRAIIGDFTNCSTK